MAVGLLEVTLMYFVGYPFGKLYFIPDLFILIEKYPPVLIDNLFKLMLLIPITLRCASSGLFHGLANLLQIG